MKFLCYKWTLCASTFLVHYFSRMWFVSYLFDFLQCRWIFRASLWERGILHLLARLLLLYAYLIMTMIMHIAWWDDWNLIPHWLFSFLLSCFCFRLLIISLTLLLLAQVVGILNLFLWVISHLCITCNGI